MGLQMPQPEGFAPWVTQEVAEGSGEPGSPAQTSAPPLSPSGPSIGAGEATSPQTCPGLAWTQPRRPECYGSAAGPVA